VQHGTNKVDVLGLVEHLLVLRSTTLLSALRARKIDKIELSTGCRVALVSECSRKKDCLLSVPVLRFVAVTYTVSTAWERLEACEGDEQTYRQKRKLTPFIKCEATARDCLAIVNFSATSS
jgi:hypothetical protein